MLAKLEEKCRRFSLSNIEIVNEDWQGFVPKEDFDLVFCSMTPLLRDSANIRKIVASSKRFIGIVTWAGVRRNRLLAELSRKILGREMDQKGQDITITFNYLYSLGLAPSLTFFTGCWEKIRPAEKQAENLIWRLEMKRPLTEAEKKEVRTKVASLADEKGLVKVVSTVRTCFMLVDKRQSKDAINCP